MRAERMMPPFVGLLGAVVLMTVYSVYTGTLRLEALSQTMHSPAALLDAGPVGLESGAAAADVLGASTDAADRDRADPAREADEEEVIVKNDADELYAENSDDRPSQTTVENAENANPAKGEESTRRSREKVQHELLHGLIQKDDEMVAIPVDAQDLRDHKLLTVLHSYIVTSYTVDLYKTPSFQAELTGQTVHRGDAVVGARLWKKEFVTWLEMAPDAYLPLAVFPNTAKFKKVAAPFLRLNSLRAFNERADEPIQDCAAAAASGKDEAECRRDNSIRREINRIIEAYDVRDYAPKSLGGTRGGVEEKRILRVIEGLFEANSPFEFPKLEL